MENVFIRAGGVEGVFDVGGTVSVQLVEHEVDGHQAVICVTQHPDDACTRQVGGAIETLVVVWVFGDIQ